MSTQTKKRLGVVVLGSLAVAVWPTRALAVVVGDTLGGQALFVIIHEDGTGLINNVPVQAFPDPVTGAPTWPLPFPVVAGDLIGTEPAQEGGGISDVLRFPEIVPGAGISDRAILFSDLPEAGEGPVFADVGIDKALPLQAAQVERPEIDGFIDYDVPGGIVDYHVFSEQIPEPSMVLLLLGASSGLILPRRRRSIRRS